jgi:hypothetical protein
MLPRRREAIPRPEVLLVFPVLHRQEEVIIQLLSHPEGMICGLS